MPDNPSFPQTPDEAGAFLMKMVRDVTAPQFSTMAALIAGHQYALTVVLAALNRKGVLKFSEAGAAFRDAYETCSSEQKKSELGTILRQYIDLCDNPEAGPRRTSAN